MNNKYPKLIETDYDSSNGAVIQADITDFGAAADGISDDTSALNAAIKCAEKTGGAVYLPKGTYKLTSPVTVPSAVQLIGDFKAPTEENPKTDGTVLAIYTKTVADGGDTQFFKLCQGSAMRGFNIWYPEQAFTDGVPKEYPYTIGLADMVATHLEDICFVNAYNCIDHFSRVNNQQICRNIYGTPLRTSVRVANVNDSNRYESFNLQPKWWLESGLPNIPDENELKNWLIENATGYEMVSTDWHYLSNFTIKGYRIGLELTNAFGRVYNMNITDCNTCLSVIAPVWYGATVTGGVFKASGGENPVALRISEKAVWGLTVYGAEFSSDGDTVIELNSGHLVIQNSSITLSGDGSSCLNNINGRFSLINTSLTGGKNHIISSKGLNILNNYVKVNWDGQCYHFAENAHETSKIVNCKADGGLKISAKVPYLIEIFDDKHNKTEQLDDICAFKSTALKHKMPKRAVLYNALEFGVSEDNADNSAALQTAIDTAFAEGGGTVYLKKGVYGLENPIVIKSGVELRGCSDGFHYITCDTTYFISDYGSGDAAAKPLISMESNSGARGFAVVYDRVDPDSFGERAVTIQGNGSDIYVINVVVSTSWTALDLETFRCDNHYIEGFNFYSLKYGIKVGSGSRNGVLRDCHSNPCTVSENPLRKHEWDNSWGGRLFCYFQENVTGYYIGDTENEVLFFTFIFGTEKGIHAAQNANLFVLGHGSDYSSNGIQLSDNAKAVIVDAQLSGSANRSHALLADPSFNGSVTLYNPCAWAIRDCSMRIQNGTVKVFGGVFFENSCSVIYSDGGDITIAGIISIWKSRCDFFALRGTKTLCAFGNIPIYKNQFIEESINFYGSDLV